jgi:WS/DGAT/MGAT family acyltransferase
MSSVDTAWLRMDRPTNRMAILGVLVFDTPLDYERLRAIIEARMLRYRRFRMFPVEAPSGSWWEEPRRFDLAHHVRRAKLPAPYGLDALKRLVAGLASRPFAPRQPWWEFHLVERYGSGSAVIVRIHHSYADGIALIGVMLSLTDASADAPVEAPPARTERAARTPDGEGYLALAATGALRLSGEALDKYVELLRRPKKVIEYAQIAGAVAGEVAQLATMPDDSPTRFKGKAGTRKAVAWAEPLPLDEVKAIGGALGCSVNDVLLATVAGALRRYLVAKGDRVDDLELRALVPVNLRPQTDDGELGNRFGLVTLLLPVGIANPLARLYEVHHRMEALKASYQPIIAFALLGLAGLLPRVAQQEMLDLLANKATAVMTNVPGPREPLFLAGARLAQILFWVPQSGDIGMGVSILSYAGGVQFGLITDAGRVPDPERIVGGIRAELERLLLTVLMEPWDARRPPALVERELAAAAAERRARSRPALRKPRANAPRARGTGAQ